MAKLLLSDENFPFPAVEHLRDLGHDVVTLAQMGRTEQAFPDQKALKLATENNRAILTINRKDFIKLHRNNDSHAGIIVCTLDVNFLRLAQNIHQAIVELPKLNKLLIRVNRR